MSVKILVSVMHKYFNEPYETWIDWDFPFLPGKGEHVNGWLWIDKKNMDKEYIESILSQEGKEEMIKFTENSSSTLADWLYEIGIEAGDVDSISYHPKDKYNPDEGICVYMYLGDYS